MSLFRSPLILLALLLAANLPAAPRPVKVFILAGQSNMEGQAVVDLGGKDYNSGKGTLAQLMLDPAKAPLFRHLRDASGKWTVRDDVWVHYQREQGPLLRGPLGVGFAVYGGSHHFGPELQFGHVMGDCLAEPVLLVKTAWGGKSLFKDFRPPSSGGEVGPYYRKMIVQVREALASLPQDFPALAGAGYELAGFVWYHGWNDGCEPKTAVPQYETNLVNLISDVRREFNAPQLPVVIGELTGPWVEAPGEWATLRQAQAAAAARPEFKGNVLFVETHNFVRKPEDSPNPSHGHHEFGNAETYFLVGDALGEGMKQLLANQSPLDSLDLVPQPKSISRTNKSVSLNAQSRVVAASPQLQNLAGVLADEIFQATGLRLSIVTGQPVAGDIVLRLDDQCKGEEYQLNTDGMIQVRGGNYGAVVLGTATLLQLLKTDHGQILVPGLAIADAPDTEYRGLLVDVARKYHSIENLKQMVQLCRLYKMRYLQLHLTDDQSFMFPSRTYPQLATQNQHRGKTYTVEELKELVAFADARHVTLIPEYEVPGHSAAANRALPDLFKIKGTKPYEHHASINFAKPEVMQAVATIVAEMCAVFQSSPYFHIGGDEADLEFAHQNAEFQAAFKKFNLTNQHQLYRKFVADMNDIVKKNGKQMIVWEGFSREPNSPVQIPKDIIVMAYEIRFYRPDHLVRDGYPVVNASWTPLYVVNRGRPPEEIYAWHLGQFKPYGAKPADPGIILEAGAKVFGAQMCAWEQPQEVELPSLRLRLPAMSERLWNPGAGKTYANFAGRLAATDQLLTRLLKGTTP